MAASYQILEGDHPLEFLRPDSLPGYDAENLLEDREIDLLLDLIRTRLSPLVAITRDGVRPSTQKTAHIFCATTQARGVRWNSSRIFFARRSPRFSASNLHGSISDCPKRKCA